MYVDVYFWLSQCGCVSTGALCWLHVPLTWAHQSFKIRGIERFGCDQPAWVQNFQVYSWSMTLYFLRLIPFLFIFFSLKSWASYFINFWATVWSQMLGDYLSKSNRDNGNTMKLLFDCLITAPFFRRRTKENHFEVTSCDLIPFQLIRGLRLIGLLKMVVGMLPLIFTNWSKSEFAWNPEPNPKPKRKATSLQLKTLAIGTCRSHFGTTWLDSALLITFSTSLAFGFNPHFFQCPKH